MEKKILPEAIQNTKISQENEEELKRALGSVIGAFCGDAAGAPLEFLPFVTQAQVDVALQMPGKDYSVGPGQVTDDSELAWSLTLGLLESGKVLDLSKILKYYGMWMKSPPFGKTQN